MKQITWQQAQSLIDCTEKESSKLGLLHLFAKNICLKKDTLIESYSNDILSNPNYDTKVSELYKSFFEEPKKEEVKFEFGKVLDINRINDYYVSLGDDDQNFESKRCTASSKYLTMGVHFTKEQSEHMAEYLQLAMEIKSHCDYLNELDGFVADFNNGEQRKYGLISTENKIDISKYYTITNTYIFQQVVSTEQRANELLSTYKERLENHFKIK